MNRNQRMVHDTMTIRVSAFMIALTTLMNLSSHAQPASPPDEPNNIRHYLVEAARQISENAFEGVESLEAWQAQRPARYRHLIEMLGLVDVPLEGERPPLNPVITGTIEEDEYTIKKLYYESLPELYVPANLYIPKNLDGPAPAVLFVCGHSRTQKVYYQNHARRFAELGFVCLIYETIQWGEVRGHHWGTYAEGRFNWASKGYSPGGVETWNGIRGIDLLQSLDEVDPERIGVTGNSGGGAYSWYIGAIDPRIKIAAPSCGTSTVHSHIHERTIDGHCDCMTPVNGYLRDLHDIGALIAPRPLLVAATTGDGLNSIHAARQCVLNIKSIYSLYGEEALIDMVEGPGGHGYTPGTRAEIFSFFLKHLKNQTIDPTHIEDIELDEDQLFSEDELRVYVDGPPAGDRTTTIHENFVKKAGAPQLTERGDWQRHRGDVLQFLREKSFRSFPDLNAPLELTKIFQDEEREQQQVYVFRSEPGYALKIDVRDRAPYEPGQPIVLVLRNRGEERWASESFSSRLPEGWNRAFFEARGVGETSWSDDLQWHVRRAALWTGRTIASMQTYDILRCLRALRSLDGVSDRRIAIAARDEMCVPAIYAAFLDGQIEALLLQNPPATHDVEGDEDGRDHAIEIINALRITDLPYLAGLLAPTQVAFIGDAPDSYQWTFDAARRLGFEESVFKLDSVRNWEPAL